jgi:hypothetical protein
MLELENPGPAVQTADLVASHLRYNVYPPVTGPDALRVAMSAINNMADGHPDKPVSSGKYRGLTRDVVALWRLSGFVEGMRSRSASKNPPDGDLTDTDKECPLIYGRLLRITMKKTHGKHKGQKFYHDFSKNPQMRGVEAGTKVVLPSGRVLTLEKRGVIVLSAKDHLWGEYL